MADVVVVGAGIAGLTLARLLSENGATVQVLDKAAYPGGRLSSRTVAGRLVDTGPTGFQVTDPEVAGVLQRLARMRCRASYRVGGGFQLSIFRTRSGRGVGYRPGLPEGSGEPSRGRGSAHARGSHATCPQVQTIGRAAASSTQAWLLSLTKSAWSCSRRVIPRPRCPPIARRMCSVMSDFVRGRAGAEVAVGTCESAVERQAFRRRRERDRSGVGCGTARSGSGAVGVQLDPQTLAIRERKPMSLAGASWSWRNDAGLLATGSGRWPARTTESNGSAFGAECRCGDPSHLIWRMPSPSPHFPVRGKRDFFNPVGQRKAESVAERESLAGPPATGSPLCVVGLDGLQCDSVGQKQSAAEVPAPPAASTFCPTSLQLAVLHRPPVSRAASTTSEPASLPR